MKTLLLVTALTISASAANFRWTIDLDASSDPFGLASDPASGWVATLTMDLHDGDTVPWLTMDLSPFYLQGSAYPAGFVRDVANAGPWGISVTDLLVHNTPYAMDPSYLTGIEGRLVGLAPHWRLPDGSVTSGAHYRGVWGAAEEWSDSDDPAPTVPEPATYGLLAGIGLLVFAAVRRFR